MPGRGLAQHFAGARVQRRIERQRAMPVVLESMALRASGRQRNTGSADPTPESWFSHLYKTRRHAGDHIIAADFFVVSIATYRLL